jgi:hypothetical protein
MSSFSNILNLSFPNPLVYSALELEETTTLKVSIISIFAKSMQTYAPLHAFSSLPVLSLFSLYFDAQLFVGTKLSCQGLILLW